MTEAATSSDAPADAGATTGDVTVPAGTDAAQASTTDLSKLPDDHPLVKAYRSTKAELADVKRKADAATEAARLAALDDAERKVEEAKAAGKAEAATEFGSLLAAAEIKAALTGIVPDPAVIVEDLNISRYVTEDGKVDAEKVAGLKAKYQALAKTPGAGSADAGPQGSAAGVKQLTRSDLTNLTPEQIVEAKAKGQLNDLIGAS